MSTYYRRRACAAVVMIAALVACASSAAKSSARSSARSATAITAASSCIPAASTKLPGDPDHVAASLTGAAKTAIEGYPGSVYKSPWANFKPKTKGPWKVGLLINEPGSYPEGVEQGLKVWAAQNKGKISGITVLQTATANSASEQIQQMRTLLTQHVSIIFGFLASPTGLNAVIDQAAKQGVPVISIAGQSTDKNAINLQPNPTQLGYDGAAGLVNAMGGKPGSVLIVHGIPGVTFDSQVVDPAETVLKACHDTIAGSVTGYFVAPTAKSATLQYLAGHPGTLGGVFQASGMASGIISAFQQLGRPVPPVADVNPVAASLVYWQQHESTYHGSGVAIAPERTGEYSMAIALALLEGRGIKITDVPFSPPIITKANLSQWVQKGWTSSTTVEANGPASALPITQLVNEYTTKQ
jgi:ribose transport system substrate-binding protein